MGQLPDGVVTLIETVEDARIFTPRDPSNLAFVTQTTLSVDDTSDIVAELKARFPVISPCRTRKTSATPRPIARRPSSGWLRREACDLVLVMGSARTPSNSQRLVEVALRAGAQATPT